MIGTAALRFLRIFSWLTFAATCLAASTTNNSLPLLRQSIAETIQASGASQGWWGVSAVCLDNGLTVYATNESRHFTPASTTKLFTVALALNRLGGEFRIRTSVMASAAPDDHGVVHGDVAIVGRGDPTMSSRFSTGNGTAADTSLINAIKAAGVKSVEGKLIFDGSWLKAAPYGSGWEWDDFVEGYAAPVSAFTINENICRLLVSAGERVNDPARASWQPLNPLLISDFQVATAAAKGQHAAIEYRRLPGTTRLQVRGSIPIGAPNWFADIACAEPSAWYSQQLRAELENVGISISETNHLVGSYEDSPLNHGMWSEIASVKSPPVSDIATLTLKPSQNLFAQLLLLHVGDHSLKQAEVGEPQFPADQEAAGIKELNRWLSTIGVAGTDVFLEEGSGLSRRNAVTPRAVVTLLHHMSRNRWSESWMKSLPIGGVDGTLQNRFTEGPARSRVHAKTGSLRGVQALAGYVTTAAGQSIAFAIYANQFTPTETSAARKTIDQVVGELAACNVRLEEVVVPAKN